MVAPRVPREKSATIPRGLQVDLRAKISSTERLLTVVRCADDSGRYIVTTSEQQIQAVSLAHVWLMLADLMERRDRPQLVGA